MVIATSLLCFFLRDVISYQVVALVLLLVVSITAILYDVFPVLLTAVLSALILNIFFIDPIFHYKINTTENILLFLVYFLIAIVSAILTNRIKKQARTLREKENQEKIIKLYNTLLSSLSHELKTPIATIIGAIDTLKTTTAITSETKELLLSEIEIAGIRLNDQVENLLNMSRLESGNLQLKKDWCDVNELVFMTISKLHDTASHNIVFNPDENLPFFKIDAGLIEQTLYVLIHNAVKYTPDDSEVEIVVTNDQDVLEIRVSDNGNGIPENEIDNVFQRFYRPTQSPKGGLGLGLSIAKGFVEAHNGSISFKNKEGGGAMFSIKFPADVSYINHLKNE